MRAAAGGRSAIRPFLERGPLGAGLLGLASGFPFAMIGATLTTRLAEAGVEKRTVTAFALAFLLYNLKFLWAPAIDRVRIPLLASAIGPRRAWLVVLVTAVMAAVAWLGAVDPQADLSRVVAATLLVGFLGASLDVVIDAFRIEHLSAGQLGAGSGMSQYGWRLGAAGAGALALVVAERLGWPAAYAAATVFALPALVAAAWLGEPARPDPPPPSRRTSVWAHVREAFIAPVADFLARPAGAVVLLFILVHKLGDTLANLSLRLLLSDLGFTKDEVAAFDVGLGLLATLAGIFAGGVLYGRLGMMPSVLVALVLMAVSNLSFAGLALMGHSNLALAAAVGFENFASGIGGVAIVAYLSWLCNLRFTATQYALLSALASVLGRIVSGTTAGALIEALGFPAFYLLTTALALPGVGLFVWLMRKEAQGPALPDCHGKRGKLSHDGPRAVG
ncbi:MAG: MFS transporter [Sphingomonadaceae bacterium]|uniref:AmpG family muropeptide MFS transporter n=1 Tax=Thermaurantiacus sp. TaxID=2820283 RepID=UPI00298F291E|nr:MFS transporter [Thermaurantiacus sp.]MCS6987436.1 MFS transporter [Sphingomonadaceae bacterium]MDW8415356.1 MFS transporter [Thermaurantiacus sp.]